MARFDSITEAQIEQIVELRLNRVPVRQIADTVGCNKDTVTKYWHDWLDETTEERRAELERKRSEVIARLDSTATLARRGAVRARLDSELDPDARARAEARYLAEERSALKELSRIAGWDAPTQIGVRFTPDMTQDEATRILAELDSV